jgi:hypothetical protein
MLNEAKTNEMVKDVFGDLATYCRSYTYPNVDAWTVCVVNVDMNRPSDRSVLAVAISVSGLEAAQSHDIEKTFRNKLEQAYSEFKHRLQNGVVEEVR